MHELVIKLPEGLVEAVGDALIEGLDTGRGAPLEALAVSVVDAEAGTDSEAPLFGEPGLPTPREGWAWNLLSALYDGEAQATEAAALLLAAWGEAGASVQALRPVADADWVRLTQSQFAPVPITPSFWIVPSWHAVPAAAHTVLRLDPGLAFGTGTHPTTRMCLRWIAREAAALGAHTPVLDYGCGSGILAIACALHGAQRLWAVDIDPAAVRATVDNAQANGVPAGHLQAGLPEALGAPAAGFGLVLANILATPLKLLAPLLSAQLAPGGRLVLAGILSRQAEQLQAAYAPWLALAVADEEDGWILMTGRRAGG